MKSSSTVPLAIILGGVIVAAAIYISLPKQPPTGSDNASLVRPVDSTDHILGNPAARVMIVEYSDFDCEFCRDFHETLHQIIANEGTDGEVAWVYREFPLTEIHPNALSHARAVECAAKTAGNDAFWVFADALFENQPVDPATYGALARATGIPGEAFAACYASAPSTLDARINADRKNALDMGANGTPYSIIVVAGKPPIVMEGAYPYGAVKQLIDEALEN